MSRKLLFTHENEGYIIYIINIIIVYLQLKIINFLLSMQNYKYEIELE